MGSPGPRLKNVIAARRWDTIRDSWLAHIPTFANPGAKPDPGLETLLPLQQLALPTDRQLLPDVPGLRPNLLSEAVFLFHKCAHTHLAAQRLGSVGMHSWSMFNAYHSAYMGARGVMALLGIGLPFLAQGGQLLIDVYPEPDSIKGKKQLIAGSWTFHNFLLVRLKRGLEQQELWDALHRILKASNVSCWHGRAYAELMEMPDGITRPRNAFLYKSAFWPGDDLLVDGSEDQFRDLVGDELDVDQKGWLLRLSYNVYWLFEQIISDLAGVSGVIREQIEDSRIMCAPNAMELGCYNMFLTDLGSHGITQ